MSPPDLSSRVVVDGVAVDVPRGVTVVAALVAANSLCTRRSVTGQRRFAFCGIGQCQECRVTVDGCANQLACGTICADGMTIATGGDW
ncbi:(2Fe-2S)-binding protein [Telluria mixta]|uniref:(2Fe-2S)-binding protein n=1 Tax=Telluria mixta TaxID=34071 RepID=A0ABT2BYR8_9BURK|nr:(2Fe-2S)-binding protein [Telluria mixta]MCS0630279.1 (2Fe-2S)-binding protein [Telluria mixta]WEM94411.1 (2Fe-2S)-binding protein [Telluria mixta]